jgi:hypothetical protein
MKTLRLKAVAFKGEDPNDKPKETRELLHDMSVYPAIDWFYAANGFNDRATPSGIDPDEIAGIAWSGIAIIDMPESVRHLDPSDWHRRSNEDGYVYAVDAEETEYLWSYDPKVDGSEADPKKFYDRHVEQIAKEIRRLRAYAKETDG